MVLLETELELELEMETEMVREITLQKAIVTQCNKVVFTTKK